MFEIKDLCVSVDKKEILHNLNLTIPKGEVHVLFGPNGSGKTSLMMTIMGFPEYKITKGQILLDNKDITDFEIDERARLGVGVSQQRPPTIRGVKLQQILDLIKSHHPERDSYIARMIEKFNFNNFLDRDINSGLSGGEIKLSELFQILVTQPKFLLIDEPDSGVDPEKLVKIGEMVNECLTDKTCPGTRIERNTSLLITHSGFILNYVHVDKAHLLINGSISCSGNAKLMLEQIQEMGYDYCVTCQRRGIMHD